MAHPGDPLGAGIVPPRQHFVLQLQVGAGLVQFFGQRPGKAGCGQLHRPAIRQRIQSVGHRLQLPGAPPAHQQADRQPQHKQ